MFVLIFNHEGHEEHEGGGDGLQPLDCLPHNKFLFLGILGNLRCKLLGESKLS